MSNPNIDGKFMIDRQGLRNAQAEAQGMVNRAVDDMQQYHARAIVAYLQGYADGAQAEAQG